MVHVAFFKRAIGTQKITFARQINKNKMSFEDVLALMGKRTSLSEADMRSVFAHFCEHLVSFLPKGHTIQTPLGVFSLGVNPEKLRLRLRCKRALVNRLKEATTLRLVETPAVPLPTIFRALPTESEGLNQGIPGEVLHLIGLRLKFSPHDLTSGVFFIDSAGAETRATVYCRIAKKVVDIKVPLVGPGAYRLEVRTTSLSKALRSGQLEASFTVLS